MFLPKWDAPTDPEVQRLYVRVLKLHQGWWSLPVPPAQQPVKHTVEQAFPRLNKRPKMAVVWGRLVIAAMLSGALAGVLPSRQYSVPTMDQAPPSVVKPGAWWKEF